MPLDIRSTSEQNKCQLLVLVSSGVQKSLRAHFTGTCLQSQQSTAGPKGFLSSIICSSCLHVWSSSDCRSLCRTHALFHSLQPLQQHRPCVDVCACAVQEARSSTGPSPSTASH